MLPYFHIPEHPASPAAHRRFRFIVGLFLGVTIVLLVLQATPRAMLPASKTSTLWGILVGLAAMGTFVEVRWARAAHRDGVG